MSNCNNKGAVASTIEALRQRPDFILILVVIAGFLYYMDRSEHRRGEHSHEADRVSQLRTETCHTIQAQSVNAIDMLTAALLENAKVDAGYRGTVNNLVVAVNEMRNSNEELRGVVVELSTIIKAATGGQAIYYPNRPSYPDATAVPSY